MCSVYVRSVELRGGEVLSEAHLREQWQGRRVEVDPPIVPVLALFRRGAKPPAWVLVEFAGYRGDGGELDFEQTRGDIFTPEFAATWLTREGHLHKVSTEAREALGEAKLPSTYRRENPRRLLTALHAYIENLQAFLEARDIGVRCAISADQLLARAAEILEEVHLYTSGMPGVTFLQALDFKSLRFTSAVSGRERLIRKALTRLCPNLFFTAAGGVALNGRLAGHLRLAAGKLRVAIEGPDVNQPRLPGDLRETRRRTGRPKERALVIEQRAILLLGSNPLLKQQELARMVGVTTRQLRNYPKLMTIYRRVCARSDSIRRGLLDSRTGEVDGRVEAETEDG